MNDTIAIIIGIILVLGLISYAVVGQVAGIKDTGDKAAIEQSKVGQIIKDSNMVTGSTVRNYARTGEQYNVGMNPDYDETSATFVGEKFKQASSDGNGQNLDLKKLYFLILNRESDGKGLTAVTNFKQEVNDSAVYKMIKIYNPDGDLHKILFIQQNLGTGEAGESSSIELVYPVFA